MGHIDPITRISYSLSKSGPLHTFHNFFPGKKRTDLTKQNPLIEIETGDLQRVDRRR